MLVMFGPRARTEESPFLQRDGYGLYCCLLQAAAEKLVEHGFAYKCYYSEEQVAHYRKVVEVRRLALSWRSHLAAMRFKR